VDFQSVINMKKSKIKLPGWPEGISECSNCGYADVHSRFEGHQCPWFMHRYYLYGMAVLFILEVIVIFSYRIY
jgi:hypothetical protein